MDIATMTQFFKYCSILNVSILIISSIIWSLFPGFAYNVNNKLFSLGYDFDVLVNRDCTAPFIRISDIKKGVSLLNRKKNDLVAAVYKTHLNPYFNMMESGSNGFLKFSKKTKKCVTNRQDAPIVYQLTGFQIINVPRFLKYKKIYMPRILPIEIPSKTGLMIDSELEFQIADCMFRKR